MKKVCLTIIIVLLAFCLCNTVLAVTSEELEQRRQELKQEIEKSGIEIENIQIELTDTLEKINEIDKQIYEYEQSVQEIDNTLISIQNQIRSTQKRIETLQDEYENVKQAFAERIVYLYETNDTRYLDVLLNSKSIVEFISNYYMIGEMAEYDANLIEKLENDKSNVEEAETELKGIQQQLEDKKLEKQKIAITLENSKVIKNSYLNTLTEQEKQTQEKLDRYQEELDLVELEMLLASLKDNDSEYVGGIFLWPLPGYYTITSPFGMRLHPILKVYRGHTGMDIGAPMGTYVLAANSGVVSTATYSNSYGNMVIINHGNGVSTAYAHASELLVEVGQEVKRGDVIMRVGSTGWSTGPHLHFEIIINGTKIDPYPYVIKNTTSKQTKPNDEEDENTNQIVNTTQSQN